MWHGRLAGAALFAFCAACAPPADGPVRTQLAKALGDQRPTVGLLTGLQAGPYRSPSRASDLPDAALLLAAVNAERAFKAAQTDVTMADMGVAALLLGDSDRAVQLLELCIATNPNRAGSLADLSAAYLEVALRSHRPDFFPLALDAASKALRLEPENPVALFNRAQALTGLKFRRLAARAWGEVWSGPTGIPKEATVDNPLTRVHPDPPPARSAYGAVQPAAYRFAASKALAAPDFGALREARRYADEIINFNQDRYWTDFLDAVESAQGEEARLAATLVAIEESLRRRDVSAAIRHLGQLKQSTRKSALRIAFEYQRSLIAFYSGERAGLARRFEAIEREARIRNYLALEVQSGWMGAFVDSLDGASSGATLSKLAWLERRAILGPTELEGAIRSRLASLYREVGAYRQAWRTQSSGADQVERLSELVPLADLLRDQDLLHAAVGVLELALAENLEPDGATVVQVDLYAARLWHQLGDLEQARKHLGRAMRRVEGMESSAFRTTLFGELALARLETDPDAFSERLLAEARRHLERGGDRSRLPGLLLAKARHSRAAGWAERVADLGEALRLARSQVASREVDEEGDYKLGRAIADHLVAEYVQRGDIDGIVASQKAARAHSVRRVATARADPDAAVVVLRYVSWRDNLALIVGSPADRRFVPLKLGVAELRWLVSRYHLLLELGGQAWEVERIERELTAALLAPAAEWLHGAEELLILPDGPIWNVPFPNLFSPISLSQRVGSTLALTIAREEELPPDWSVSKPPTNVLAIGYSPREGTAAQLPFAEEEARVIASGYRSGLALTGKDATRSNLLKNAPGREVVHVAAHAFSSIAVPARAALFLAPRDGDTGVVGFDDRLWAQLGRARVVVLSTCLSARGQARFAGAPPGPVSLLLARGARYVVASTVPVDDAASLTSMRILHEFLQKGLSPQRAVLAAHQTARTSQFAQSSGVSVYR